MMQDKSLVKFLSRATRLLFCIRTGNQFWILRALWLIITAILPELDIAISVDAAAFYKLALSFHQVLNGKGDVGEYLLLLSISGCFFLSIPIELNIRAIYWLRNRHAEGRRELDALTLR